MTDKTDLRVFFDDFTQQNLVGPTSESKTYWEEIKRRTDGLWGSSTTIDVGVVSGATLSILTHPSASDNIIGSVPWFAEVKSVLDDEDLTEENKEQMILWCLKALMGSWAGTIKSFDPTPQRAETSVSGIITFSRTRDDEQERIVEGTTFMEEPNAL